MYKRQVQNIRPVGYGGHLKVTTAKYYIPSGRCIQAIDYSHRNEDGSAVSYTHLDVYKRQKCVLSMFVHVQI